MLCYWAVKELEMKGATVARKLKVTNSVVSRFFARGEKTASEMKLKLINIKKRTLTTPSLLFLPNFQAKEKKLDNTIYYSHKIESINYWIILYLLPLTQSTNQPLGDI